MISCRRFLRCRLLLTAHREIGAVATATPLATIGSIGVLGRFRRPTTDEPDLMHVRRLCTLHVTVPWLCPSMGLERTGGVRGASGSCTDEPYKRRLSRGKGDGVSVTEDDP